MDEESVAVQLDGGVAMGLAIAAVRVVLGAMDLAVETFPAQLQRLRVLDDLTMCAKVLRRALAGICEMLATRYAQVADLQVGPRRESFGQISKAYSQRAKDLRDRYGEPEGVWAVPVIRVDGYSNSVTSTELDTSGSEYAWRSGYYTE